VRAVIKLSAEARDEVLLLTTELQLLKGGKESARETLAAAKKKIDTMGCHRWDFDAAELEKRL